MASLSAPLSFPLGGDDESPIVITVTVDVDVDTPAARDLAIDLLSRELVITNGDLTLTSGLASVLQDVLMGLSFWQGEWFGDPSYGVPYRQEILVKSPDLAKIRAIFRSFFLSRLGVTQVVSMDLGFDGNTRALTGAVQLKIDPTLLNVATQVAT
jgi:hypothetical protein